VTRRARGSVTRACAIAAVIAAHAGWASTIARTSVHVTIRRRPRHDRAAPAIAAPIRRCSNDPMALIDALDARGRGLAVELEPA
jgi:hypothetical protein